MSLDGSDSGENVADWGGVSPLAVGAEGFQQCQNARRLEVKTPPYWQSRLIGAQIYQIALIISRDLGNDINGSKISSRGTSEFERDPVMSGKGEDWKSTAVADWFLSITEGVLKHVLVIPFEVYEMWMDVSEAQKRGD